jgi:histidinol dehydrogenase
MLSRIDLRGVAADAAARLPRAQVDREAARATVREIVASVRERGDEAVAEVQARFGHPATNLRVPQAEIDAAAAACAPALLAALHEAAARIRAFHERQAAEERAPFWRLVDDGTRVGEETAPLRRAGCYVPGGRAAYPSTVLMTALPARIAGVGAVVVACPPGEDGHIHPATLAACAIAGVDEVYAMGGAQAVAALAYGTASCERTDVIVGPGNLYVSLAKHEVALDVRVDGFAGPTEILIVADETAPARFVAADLVAQAEHDPLAGCVLVTTSETLADEVIAALDDEVARASRREDVEAALKGQGCVAIVADIAQALAVANDYAPEHLELMVADGEAALREVHAAGAIFVGAYSPVSLGDYIAGTNHVLPTAGTARFASPLRVTDFIRTSAVIRFERDGLARVAPALFEIAGAEGLDAHARAVAVRLEDA